MAVPSYITERLNLIAMHRRKLDEASLADTAAQTARLAAKADLNKRRSLLTDLAIDICAWRDGLTKPTEARRLWDVLGGARIQLCAMWYSDGLPVEEENFMAAHASVSLDGPNHQFLIEEWRNGKICREVGRPTTPIQWLDMAHPFMIEDLQTFLSGPLAWQPIIDELDRRLATFTTR